MKCKYNNYHISHGNQAQNLIQLGTIYQYQHPLKICLDGFDTIFFYQMGHNLDLILQNLDPKFIRFLIRPCYSEPCHNGMASKCNEDSGYNIITSSGSKNLQIIKAPATLKKQK